MTRTSNGVEFDQPQHGVRREHACVAQRVREIVARDQTLHLGFFNCWTASSVSELEALHQLGEVE